MGCDNIRAGGDASGTEMKALCDGASKAIAGDSMTRSNTNEVYFKIAKNDTASACLPDMKLEDKGGCLPSGDQTRIVIPHVEPGRGGCAEPIIIYKPSPTCPSTDRPGRYDDEPFKPLPHEKPSCGGEDPWHLRPITLEPIYRPIPIIDEPGCGEDPKHGRPFNPKLEPCEPIHRPIPIILEPGCGEDPKHGRPWNPKYEPLMPTWPKEEPKGGCPVEPVHEPIDITINIPGLGPVHIHTGPERPSEQPAEPHGCPVEPIVIPKIEEPYGCPVEPIFIPKIEEPAGCPVEPIVIPKIEEPYGCPADEPIIVLPKIELPHGCPVEPRMPKPWELELDYTKELKDRDQWKDILC